MTNENTRLDGDTRTRATTYHIENATTGVCLGDYQGATAQEALDAMARDAGYANYADAQDVSPAELTVTELE
jgi:hypothetical protein